MDPNTALQIAREGLEAYDLATDPETRRDAAFDVTEAFRNLDDWLSQGGFPPEGWTRNRQ